jgi:ABC-type transport system involved in multi-copper enzyme maturation permease subunit
MIRSELFKITRHRTPWVLVVIYSLAVLAAPGYYLFKRPESTADYLDTVTGVFTVAGLLVAPIFGAWMVGNEYRHGTLRRVLAVDARRGRLLATKAALGLATALAALTTVAGIGFTGAAAVAAVHGDSLVTDDVIRLFVGSGFIALVSGVIAFTLSVVLRNDTYAMLGTLAVMVVFGPLLSAIPKVGNYTPSAVSTQVADSIQGIESSGALSLSTAVLTLVLTLGAASIAASRCFAIRDV